MTRALSGEPSLPTADSRSTTVFAAFPTSPAISVTDVNRSPCTSDPSTYPPSQSKTTVGTSSVHRARTPCAHDTADSDAPLKGSFTDLKNSIHGSRADRGIITTVVRIVLAPFLGASSVKSQ